MRKLPGTCVVFLTSAFVAAAHEEPQQQPQPQPQQQQAQAARPKRPGVSTPGVKIPITRLKPDHVFDVPGVPDWLAIDAHVWVSNYPKNSVTRIDPVANKIVETITVGKNPCSGLAAGLGSLWVPNCGDSTITRLNLKDGKVEATLPFGVPDSEGGLAVGAGSLWVMIDKKGTLARIDPATNKVVAEIYVAPGSYAVAFGEDAVWVTSTEKNLVTRVNARTNVVETTIPVGPKPRFLTTGEGVGVDDQPGGRQRLAHRCEDEQGGRDDRMRHPRRWRRDLGRRRIRVGDVVRVPDHAHRCGTNKVVQQFEGPGGDAIRFGHGSVWLSNLRAANVWRIDPKRIIATLPE